MKRVIAIFCSIAILLTALPITSLLASAESTRTDTLASGERITVNSGQSETTEVRFDTPIDASGSNGYIILTDQIYNVHAVTIRLYTTNKTGNSYRIGSSNRNGTAGEYNHIIPLSSMGLTDEDIASITGYDITTDGATATVYYDYSITVPALISESADFTSTVKSSTTITTTNTNWSSQVKTEFFDTPLDCSNSKEYILIEQDSKVKTKMTFTLYTASGSSKRYVMDNSQVSESTETTTEISLDDLGLTDEALSYVIGYQVILSVSSSVASRTYSISIPKANIITDTLAESTQMTANANTSTTNKVRFDTPLDCSGSNGYIILTDTCTTNSAVSLRLYTETYPSGSSSRRISVTERKTNLGTIDGTEYNTVIPLSDMGLTDADLACITGYDVTTESPGSSAVYYTYSIKIPRKIEAEASSTETVKESTTISLPNTNWSSKVTTEFFDTPIDASGSNGYVLFKQDSKVKTKITLTLYTASGNSKRYVMDNSGVSESTETTTQISLDDFGLTDEQLSYIIGYQVIFSVSSSVSSRTYSISIPVAPIISDTLASSERITVNSGQSETTEVRFDTPIDASGSNGYIILTDQIYNVHAVTIRLYTTNKTGNSYRIGSSNRNGTAGEYNHIIPLSSMGLTDEDIASITGYDITTDSATATVYYDYSITVPRKIEVDAVESATIESPTTYSLPNTNWSSKVNTVFFDTPIDCSSSDEYILIKQDSKVQTKITFTLYTASGSSKRYVMDNSQVSESTETTTKISLTDLGLTDEALSYVIGYQMIFSVSSSVASRTYSIYAPKTPVISEEIEKYATVNSGNWGNTVEIKTVDFDTFRDFSTNAGYIEVEYSSTVGRPDSEASINLTLTINTTTKSVTLASGFLPYKTANVKQKYLFYIEDLGLTNEELSETMGYSIKITQSSNESVVAYSIKVPSIVPLFSSNSNIHLPYDYIDGYLMTNPNTMVTELINSYPYAIISNGDNTVTEGIVTTGMSIKLVYNDVQIDTATIVVINDADKDGTLTTNDMIYIRNSILDKLEFDGEQLVAVAVNQTEKVCDIRSLVRANSVFNGDIIEGQISIGEWKADKFYLSSGRVPSTAEGLQNYKDLGYNLAEVIYNIDGSTDAVLAEIESLGGLDVVLTDASRFTLNSNESLVYSESSIRKAVQKFSRYKNIVGYEVFDEIKNEGANYSNAKNISSYLNKYDPNSLKFTNLLPSYGEYTWEDNAFETYVTEFIASQNPQVLSFDYYPYLMGTQDATSDWWRDLGLFRVKSIEHSIPFWYYYQGIAVGDEDKPTNAQIKNQMYVGVAYGAKGLSEWLALGDGLNTDGTQSELFEETKERNNEIITVGNFLFDKISTAIYHTGIDSSYNAKFYLDDISNSDLIASASDSQSNGLIISVFEDEANTKYMLVVNKSATNETTANISLDANMIISKLDKSAGTEINVGESNTISIPLAAGGGEVYILK